MKAERPKHKLPFNNKTLWIMAVIGLVIFLYVQVFPLTSTDGLQQEPPGKIISKDKAIQAADQFAQTTLGLDHIDTGVKPLVTYQSNSEFYGYLSKKNLLSTYNNKYEKRFPYDTYRVSFSNPASFIKQLDVDIHMTTGDVVGFEAVQLYSRKDREVMLDQNRAVALQTLQQLEGNLSLTDKQNKAIPFLEALGYRAQELDLVSGQNDLGLTYRVNKYTIGDSHAELRFQFEYGQVSSLESAFSVPQSHVDYVNKQTRLANWLYFGGYTLLSFVLGILAIIYSARTRPYASFGRGIFLTILYFAVNIFSVFNLMPVLQSQNMSKGTFTILLVVQFLFTLMVTASIYFSLVGGDGLWRKQGINMWMRANEPGYGSHVLNSMIRGYAWALILLGAQSIIFVLLEGTIHSWSTTDATQSTYNMVYPWLFPLVAWTAGIGEEAVYRLFGIPMLKKIFRSTWIASLISSLIWAFGHTLYPIYPVFSRPIELAFIGLLFSFIFLRSGYITVLFAHVIFDSVLMGLSLMIMGDIGNILIGVVYILLPAAVGSLIYVFKRRKPGSPALVLED
ncbi:CPBP family intramembrane glutamic endopeptidase [Paenibacillus sp. SN-8-1]|uniref:CPBP family intramembrane glutamic endopeptidase n=1 Tax=Paenibacillus sp. SN-8-1 TaxID=3435409 RepID=UPI003D9AAC82